MSMVYVVFKLPDGTEQYVPPGSVIGRLISSPVVIDDPRISEAHALVTHRGGSLWMIGLQSRTMRVEGGKKSRQIKLVPELRISLVDGYTVEVIEVAVPDRLPVVEARTKRTGPWQLLGPLDGHEFYSIGLGPKLSPGLDPNAPVRLVSGVESWVLYDHSGVSIPIEDVEVWEGPDFDLRIKWVPANEAGIDGTMNRLQHYLGYSLEERNGVVEVIRKDPNKPNTAERVSLSQHQGKLIAALRGGKTHRWKVVGSKVWEDWDSLDNKRQQRRWYVLVHRTRTRLREAGLDPDILYKDGDCPGRYGFRDPA